MKLSQVIEHMVVSGKYGQQNEYMCNALKENDLREHVDAVQDMVNDIHPPSYHGTPLVCALHEAKIINMNTLSWHDQRAFTAQLYCWWVFDLKRKGL